MPGHVNGAACYSFRVGLDQISAGVVTIIWSSLAACCGLLIYLGCPFQRLRSGLVVGVFLSSFVTLFPLKLMISSCLGGLRIGVTLYLFAMLKGDIGWGRALS